MTDLSVKRTLVKSPPELWSELSEVESLARHLGELGEIRISRLEPEHTVAWEGEQVRGTVEIEAAGWGTTVTLRAEVVEAPAPDPAESESVVGEAEIEREVEVEPEAAAAPLEASAPGPELDPETPAREPRGRRTRQRRGLLGRLFSRRRHAGARPVTAARGPVIEPILASAIADGTVEVVEKGSGRPDRGPSLAASPRGEPERVPEPIAAAPSSALLRAQAVLESTLDSLGQAHHRPFSRE